jgi:hypothetical protein
MINPVEYISHDDVDIKSPIAFQSVHEQEFPGDIKYGFCKRILILAAAITGSWGIVAFPLYGIYRIITG